jgi:hypothetical protein
VNTTLALIWLGCALATLSMRAQTLAYRLPDGCLPGKTIALKQTPELSGEWEPTAFQIDETGVISLPGNGVPKLFFSVSISSPYVLRSEVISINASLDDLRGAFAPGTWKNTVLSVLHRAFPTGEWVAQTAGDQEFSFWFQDTSSFESSLQDLATAVHESSHAIDGSHYQFSNGRFNKAYLLNCHW